MVDIVTYYSENALIERCWIAQVVLPNGSYWGVYFSGCTEDAVRQKAIELWNKEHSRAGSGVGSGSIPNPKPNPKPSGLRPCVKSDRPSPDSPSDQTPLLNDPWASVKPAENPPAKLEEVTDRNGIRHSVSDVKQHHLANTVWVIHKDTREKIRIPLTEIGMYEKQGYERGGPRSK